MLRKSNLENDLEELRQLLPDPFDLPSKIDVWFKYPAAEKLIAGGDKSIKLIINYLKSNPDPALGRVAMLLLSRFRPDTFYRSLLLVVEKADKPLIQALEIGLWLIQLPEQQIAQDLVNIVATSGNPYPLLLLQRPAAKVVHSQLSDFVRKNEMPLSLYALYCYEYTLDTADAPLMTEVSKRADVPEMSALAGLYLLKLGSKDGVDGIRTGLMASNEQIRTMTYYELSKYLSKTIVDQSIYDPRKPGENQLAAADTLIENLHEI